MKSLIKLIIIVVLISFLASCGKDNKVGSGVSGGNSISPINSGNTNLDSFYSKVTSQQFATVYGNYDSVEYNFNDLDDDYDFTREYVKSTGAIYRDDDGYNTKSAIVNFLASIMTHRQNYRAGCDVYPTNLMIYWNIFHRDYIPYDCYTFVSNSTTYYIDLNYPLEANPIATIRYLVTQDEWWIFDTWKTTMDGYYLSDVDVLGYYY